MARVSLWALLAAYALARVGQSFPAGIPIVLTVALHVMLPLAFAVIHGSAVYGPRGILRFILLTLLIGNLMEDLGVLTGFPYGHYHFTAVMGPKIFTVPILLGLAYTGMGYLAWTLACLILGDRGEPLAGSRLFTRPAIAALVMVAWDFAQDPVWSNLVHAWTWHDGGAYFGVPLSNYAGWYLTVYLMFLAFALTLRTRSAPSPKQPAWFWRTAILFYAVSALGNLLVASPPQSVVVDSAGVPWRVSAILQTSDLVSVFVMGGFALLAWIRLHDAARRS
ncbi:MAG TPA: carotenoid biosynthesis protein [Bryobacteraceae bacterium]|nr:carotenoid biosynthesis protein [Bryobacteraceae bacterium]